MIVCWIVFPVVLTAVAVGCGLLLERVAGVRVPGPLLPLLGLCVIAIVGQATTEFDSTAELTLPIALVIAVAGAVLARNRGGWRLDPWAAVAAVGTFVIYGAPVIFSGDATFAGYIRLDDTASWLALTDRALEAGSNVDGLAPSTYEATLDFYLNSDYPLGALIPLGVGGDLIGQDLAWVWQPYLCLLAALLALALYALLAETGLGPRARALIALVAAQPALLFGYTLWGGFKEIATAALVVLIAVLALRAITERVTGRGLLPLGVASAGVLAVLSVGGGIWVLPLLLPVAVQWFRIARGEAIRNAVWLTVIVAVLSVPSILAAGFFGRPAASTITQDDRLANLIEPLSLLQVFGIWPAGDFRVRPEEKTLTYVLIAVMAVAVAVGAVWAIRRRRWTLLLYGGGVLLSCGVTVVLGSHWVDAKALSIASPVLALAAMLGIVVAFKGWARVPAVALGVAVVGGIVWSNAVAYHEANLAPRDRMAELEEIGEQFAGEGPTLVNQYEPPAARWFLRDADPESISELRRRFIYLRNGDTVPKGGFADVDQIALPDFFVYRTIVQRRSPSASRPPAAYRLVQRGRYYDVWQRSEPLTETTMTHVALGGPEQPTAPVPCAQVRALQEQALPTDRIVGVRRPAAVFVNLGDADVPRGWSGVAGQPAMVRPEGEGTLTATMETTEGGEYDVWLGGEPRGEAKVSIAREKVGSARHTLSYAEAYKLIGTIELDAGRHLVEIEYGAGDLHPGSGGFPEGIGPLALTRADDARRLEELPPEQAERFCGEPLDWISLMR
ncbi:MAG TPA: hypothetical protein VD790_06720 [Thermoleophilaceae bacterium]|nr:hypothetical protein [Thermoleophilaceae bacterium]